MEKIVKYNKDKSYNQQFFQVLNFIKGFNEDYQYLYFHWSRWEWMFARDSFEEKDLSKITIFYNNDKIDAIILFEDEPNTYYLIYNFKDNTREKLIRYIVENHFSEDLVIPRDDKMISLLEEKGYSNLGKHDPVSRFKLNDFELPKTTGYIITSLVKDYQLDQIHQVLWRGFNHGDNIDYSEKSLLDRLHMTSSPNFKKEYTYVAIKDNSYKSYSGIWYLKNTKTALIEPLATVPLHRRKGLAKALVYKCIKAVKEEGAKDVFVGSTQKFYFDIGFEEFDYAYKFKKQTQD
ncbi:MAG: GNAT family N-acetyltransferase [Candidatus Izemoplasmatales bacterium]